MLVSGSFAWKLALAVLLLGAIVVSTVARAPRRSISGGDLRRLVGSALVLYAIGAAAWLSHHVLLAVLVYAAGIAIAALAAWLSRGGDAEDPPSAGRDPHGQEPPPDPDGLRFDWKALERELGVYTDPSERRVPVRR
jgi:hypothetical protein